jgi:hypothetical protein
MGPPARSPGGRASRLGYGHTQNPKQEGKEPGHQSDGDGGQDRASEAVDLQPGQDPIAEQQDDGGNDQGHNGTNQPATNGDAHHLRIPVVGAPGRPGSHDLEPLPAKLIGGD